MKQLRRGRGKAAGTERLEFTKKRPDIGRDIRKGFHPMKFDRADFRARVRRQGQSLRAPLEAFFARKDVRATLNWLKEPVLAVAVVFTLTTIVAQPFYVPSGSMQPTLAIGDLTLAAKFPYGYSRYSIPYMNGPSPSSRLLGQMPKVGDVVVFRLPSNTSVTYVKRVVGLPGDRIQMKQGRLWINGRELPLRPDGTGEVEAGPDEPGAGEYVAVPKFIETLPDGVKHPIYKWRWDGQFDNTDVYVVPKGCLFMMGDNRDDSSDSRVPPDLGGVGYVPYGNLMGKVFVVLASVDFTNAAALWDWPFEFRLSRMFKGVR
ncbi:MAG: signal peptidase I [Alphaproteobacteria bacterium]|nr:signal peptidase I [Alphaproteobacteria bacterium]MDE2163914.1 signal peptidase I [Alphaproteobacteria bacterium]MDE2266596.1 signal peptidase I [Alphaproteobacteria bacterium]